MLLVGMVWLGSLTSTIVLPLIAAGVIAAVAGQLVSLMQRHRVPRGLGALAVLLLIVAAGALATYLILAGIGSEASDSYKGLVEGVATGIAALSSIVFFLAMTTLSLFFLLKDGPQIRSWVERHMGVPTDLAKTITSRTLQSLRVYFLGVTIVAAFNAVLIGGAAARRPPGRW